MRRMVLIVVMLSGFLLSVGRGEDVKKGTAEHAKYLRDGAPAMLTLKIVDENGVPVVNAKVSANFEMYDGTSIDGTSNTNGLFSMKDKTRWKMHYGISKEGCYSSSGEYLFGNSEDDIVVRDGKWQPWNPEVAVSLRPILNPIPMYAKRIDTMIPATNTLFGFDLMNADWVQPAGNGIVSDLIFRIDGFWHNYRENNSKLCLDFRNPNDGLVVVNADELRQWNAFVMPRYAPEVGYQKTWVWQRSRETLDDSARDRIIDDLSCGGNYMFRIRSETNNVGTITNAFYGKIHGNIEFVGAGEGTNGSWLKFTYYLNPTPNDRNLEFDPKRNLFKNLKSTEEVREP